MAAEMVWNFEVQGVPCKVELKKNKVSVNNAEPVKLTTLEKKTNLLTTHYSIMIEDKEAVLHIKQFSNPVLSYDGRDCATGEEYVPTKMPGWAWVFIVLHLAEWFLLIGGAIGGAIQGIVIAALVSVSSDTKKSTGMRVLVCLGILLLSTAVQFVLASWLSQILL